MESAWYLITRKENRTESLIKNPFEAFARSSSSDLLDSRQPLAYSSLPSTQPNTPYIQFIQH